MKSLLLIISGSIAAYKSLELLRLLKTSGVELDVILTRGGAEFITPLAVSSLSGHKTYTDLFSLTDEVEMGHIQLSRKHNAILVAPASADLLAKMAAGLADDLATTTLLATNKPVIVAPAMNAQMWAHPATQRNLKQLKQDGIQILMPGSGELACGEVGAGRMMEPAEIMRHLSASLSSGQLRDTKQRGLQRNQGKASLRILVTAGPTHEPIDPVRYIGNHSSGKQGIAIASALAARGAEVHLVLGPTSEIPPANVHTHRVTTAQEMFDTCSTLMPVDVAICTAAVADWGIKPASRKLKKRAGGETPQLKLTENPDILAMISHRSKNRPKLVIGFAAETDNLEKHAREKLAKKGCDWLLANDVSGGKVFGAESNQVLFLSGKGKAESWKGTKTEIAGKLADKILEKINNS